MDNYKHYTNEDGKSEIFDVYLIHGRAMDYKVVEKFIEESLKFRTHVSIKRFRGGQLLNKIKNDIWKKCDCAIAILSPDDVSEEGVHYARQNVVFELGYCMGFLDYHYFDDDEMEPVILIKEKSVQLNTDLEGIEIIEYQGSEISMAFEKLEEGLLGIFNKLTQGRKIRDSNSNDAKVQKNDLKVIKTYMADSYFTVMSFERIVSNINERYTKEYLLKLIERFPTELKRSILENGKQGIKLLKPKTKF